MAGLLQHSPADVVRRMLIDLSLGTDPDARPVGAWPVYASGEPGAGKPVGTASTAKTGVPDSIITVYDTLGRQNGRIQFSGEIQEHHGFQVRVRAAGHSAGYAKARAIADGLDKSVYLRTVAIGASRYLVYAVTRTGDVLALGKEPTSGRRIFTINALVTVRQTA